MIIWLYDLYFYIYIVLCIVLYIYKWFYKIYILHEIYILNKIDDKI